MTEATFWRMEAERHDRSAPSACPECSGTGMVWTDGCTCGAGPGGYYGMHERHCGAEPCPSGCPVRVTG